MFAKNHAQVPENRFLTKEIKMKKSIISIFLIFSVIILFPANLLADSEAVDQQGLVDSSRILFESFMADPNMEWFRENLSQAKGLLIVPSLLKGGFILGGSGGSGVLLARDRQSGEWSQPVFYTIGSVTFGLQIGGEKSEVIMMIRSRRALESLYASSFKLGGDISVAAGPIGGGAKANVLADILSFVRSKGLYGGVSLEGAVVKIRDDWNKVYYGKYVRPTDIIIKKSVSNPGSKQLRSVLAQKVK